MLRVSQMFTWHAATPADQHDMKVHDAELYGNVWYLVVIDRYRQDSREHKAISRVT